MHAYNRNIMHRHGRVSCDIEPLKYNGDGGVCNSGFMRTACDDDDSMGFSLLVAKISRVDPHTFLILIQMKRARS